MNKDSIQKATLRQRITARSKALTTGRFEITRPLKPLTVEQRLERNFDRSIILCRETIQEISWVKALETLRVWEYTGRVRRGYFIEGMSGIQFLRDKDFNRIMSELERPQEGLLWLSAIDPLQPWGKCLPHHPDRAFMNNAGTAVALKGGRPIAVLERQGKVLRVFNEDSLLEALSIFIKDYNQKRMFPSVNRITIKQYPTEAAQTLVKAGFMRELQDYVLYKSNI